MQISSISLRSLFRVSLAFALASMAALSLIDAAIQNASAPYGIVSFELCAYSSSCATIVRNWQPHAQLMAALSLGVDYLFMLAYSAALFFGLLLVAERLPSGLRRITVSAAWLSWVAGAADAVENYCLARMLVGRGALEFAWPASLAATLKFVVFFATLGWLLFAYLRYGVWGPRSPSDRG